MYFVREHAGKMLIQSQTPVFSPVTGEKIKVLPQVWLDFYRGRAPEWAVAAGEPLFTWSMRPRPGANGGADIPVEQWMVFVDTDEWAATLGLPEEVKLVAEAKLLADPDSKQVFAPVLTPPWPSYNELVAKGGRTDEKVAESNLLLAEQVGVTVAEIIAYEEAVQNREIVLAAYREALDEEDDEEPVITEFQVTA